MRWRQLTGLHSTPNNNQTVCRGWKEPSLRGGSSRQFYSAGEGGWRGPSLRGGGSRQSYSAGLLLVGTIETLATVVLETALSGATSSRLFRSSCVLLLYLLPSSLSPFLLILSSILCCVAVEILL
jgi:hypothetical protein